MCRQAEGCRATVPAMSVSGKLAPEEPDSDPRRDRDVMCKMILSCAGRLAFDATRS